MRKEDVKTIDDIENYYEQVRSIRFVDNIIIANVQDIFKRLINPNINHNKRTVYTKGGKHCNPGKVRSLDDLIKISKYYFPGILVKEVLLELYLYEEDLPANQLLAFGYCPNIRKANFAIATTGYGYTKFKINMSNKEVWAAFRWDYQGFRNCAGYIYDIF